MIAFLKKNHRSIAVILGIAIAYGVIQLAVAARQQGMVSHLQAQQEQQLATAQNLAAVIARLGADPVADTIVSTCPTSDLATYNSLLGRLNDNLLLDELRQLDRLFGRCGYRNFQRRSILLLQLEQAVSQLVLTHELQAILGNNSQSGTMALWQELVAAEEALTLQFRKLTELQDQIIQTLLLNAATAEADIEVIFHEVRQTRDAMAVRNLQLDTLRGQLIES